MFNYILNSIILHTILYFTQAFNSTLYISSLELLKNISISFEKKCSVAYKYNRIFISKPLLNEINIKLSGFLLYISFLARCGYHFDSDNDSFFLFIDNDSSLHLPTIPYINLGRMKIFHRILESLLTQKFRSINMLPIFYIYYGLIKI
jgi:hypothetical protein